MSFRRKWLKNVFLWLNGVLDSSTSLVFVIRWIWAAYSPFKFEIWQNIQQRLYFIWISICSYFCSINIFQWNWMQCDHVYLQKLSIYLNYFDFVFFSGFEIKHLWKQNIKVPDWKYLYQLPISNAYKVIPFSKF